ncbi:MAG: hypothetical protein ACPG3X_08190 [Opitutales bacterium]
MENAINQLKSAITGISGLLIAAIGLLIVVSVIFGNAAGMNVIANLQALVDGFIGSGASLASVVTLVIVTGLLSR